jgi:hypothetical protein
MRFLSLVGLVLVLSLAACSGDDGGEPEAVPDGGTQAQPAAPQPPADQGTQDAGPGKVLLAFVKAAGRDDAGAMWDLLSEPTQASIGPTFEDFRGGAAQEFSEGLGSLAPTAKVILSRTLRNDWAVAAVAGERMAEGEPEYFAYGAALLPEEDELKLELGGVVVTGHKPEPLAEITERTPRLAANVGAGGDLDDLRMWIDGTAISFERGANDTPFTASMTARPARPLAPGRHEVVVFASTSETATASAWTFTVR